jgi:xanthine dehydrogenase accessory factor
MSLQCTHDVLVLIRGAGDLASGVAARLHRSGFPVVMTELPQPLMVRRTVCFGEAVYTGEVVIEGISGRRVADLAAVGTARAAGAIPILVDPAAANLAALAPQVLVDAIMAKHNTGTTPANAPLVIALGPGFTAGVDCHAVIETNRGHWLGRVIWDGPAEPDTGTPGEIAGRKNERVLRAPVDGVLIGHAAIGDQVVPGQVLASVDRQPVTGQLAGVLRGMLHPGIAVAAGTKIGDIDPRAEPTHCFTFSDKSLAVGGGVLEAILSGLNRA